MRVRPESGTAARGPVVPTLRECKIRASLLLKALRSADRERALAAAERFRVLPRFAALAPERIAAWSGEIRRKHALAVVAAELGYRSWVELRDACEAEHPGRPVNVERLFAGPASDVFLNHWCRTYEEARTVHERADGFLFPYRAHFVVCPPGVLAARGVDPFDPDWRRIGHDWVRPRDQAAFARLTRRLADAGLAD